MTYLMEWLPYGSSPTAWQSQGSMPETVFTPTAKIRSV